MSSSRDIQIAVFFVILTNLLVLLSPAHPIRTLLGILMVLFLPGYALIAALFPTKSDMGNIERLALSFGLSIAIAPLIGLGLNFTPFGIRLIPVLFSLSIFTLAMCVIAYLRRLKLPGKERFTVPFSDTYSSLKGVLNSESRIDKILTIILIFSIFISITMLMYVIAAPKQGEKFTEFYILGDKGKAGDYPTSLEAGKNSSVIVGIINQEYIPTNYTLKILLKNDTLYMRNIQLMHNSTWEERVSFMPESIGEKIKLQFLLYKEEKFTAPYKDLRLWVNVT